MTTDLDIYRTAWVLIRQRGSEADLEAAMMADRFETAGNLAASDMWKRVLAVVREIQRGSQETAKQ